MTCSVTDSDDLLFNGLPLLGCLVWISVLVETFVVDWVEVVVSFEVVAISVYRFENKS